MVDGGHHNKSHHPPRTMNKKKLRHWHIKWDKNILWKSLLFKWSIKLCCKFSSQVPVNSIRNDCSGSKIYSFRRNEELSAFNNSRLSPAAPSPPPVQNYSFRVGLSSSLTFPFKSWRKVCENEFLFNYIIILLGQHYDLWKTTSLRWWWYKRPRATASKTFLICKVTITRKASNTTIKAANTIESSFSHPHNKSGKLQFADANTAIYSSTSIATQHKIYRN